MAILVEEKKSVNIIGILTVLVIIVVIFVGGYYLFFKRPDAIEIILPSGLENINELSQIQFNPGDVVESTSFKLLRDYTTPLTTPVAGRENPFAPF